MRTVEQLVECYERWASDGEALANQIIADMGTASASLQRTQRESAETLLEEVRLLREDAARLRETWSLRRFRPPLRTTDV
jgi:hypothetical protein